MNYSVTELPEHLNQDGIPPFFRVHPWHQAMQEAVGDGTSDQWEKANVVTAETTEE